MRTFAPMNDFKDMTSAQLLDIILQGNERSDEVMYYVLKERVGERLKEKFRTHEHVFFEEFEDIVDDFFLYLRGGNGRDREQPGSHLISFCARGWNRAESPGTWWHYSCASAGY